MSRKELITTYFTGLAVLAMILALSFKGIDTVGGIGYQYFIDNPQPVFMLGLRVGSVTLGYRPYKNGRITVGVEVR